MFTFGICYIHVPGMPVRLAIDPGYAGAYAVEVLQCIDGREVIVDEIYERGLVTEEIIEMARSRPVVARRRGRRD